MSLAAVGLLISGCGAINGNAVVRGPISASLRFFPPVVQAPVTGIPRAGHITFHSADGKSTTVSVGKTGDVRLSLRAGKYWASGEMADSNLYCIADGGKHFTIVTGQELSVRVICVGI